jgi:hypothetical protein
MPESIRVRTKGNKSNVLLRKEDDDDDKTFVNEYIVYFISIYVIYIHRTTSSSLVPLPP